MSAHQSKYLLAAFLGVLAARGLPAESLDPWHAWTTFKQFARTVDELPDPGVSVQIAPLGNRRPIRLYLLRQVVERRDNRLEPVGAVVCEFLFPKRRRAPSEWEAWSFDFPDFERFVDTVEQHPLFADLLITKPLMSDVYWEDA
jgi:hypothetical protein